MATSVAQLQTYMGAGLNIMLQGLPGTGKTAMMQQAAANLGWRMQYFSTPTLDPFLHIIGLPVPDTDAKKMEFYRGGELEEAEVIFFDEANRAPDQVINAILEITQFHQCNGVPLPKLKSVVIAVNPAGDALSEGTEELSTAFVDRFDVYLESSLDMDYQWLKAKYGEAYAKVGVDLFREHKKSYEASQKSKDNAVGYLSPRRVDKLMEIFKLFPKAETVRAVLPSDVVVHAGATAERFQEALNKDAGLTRGTRAAQAAMGDRSKQVQAQLALDERRLRSRSNALDFTQAYEWAREHEPTKAAQLLTKLAPAVNQGVGAASFVSHWGVVRDFTPSQRRLMMRDWDWTKEEQVRKALGW